MSLGIHTIDIIHTQSGFAMKFYKTEKSFETNLISIQIILMSSLDPYDKT